MINSPPAFVRRHRKNINNINNGLTHPPIETLNTNNDVNVWQIANHSRNKNYNNNNNSNDNNTGNRPNKNITNHRHKQKSPKPTSSRNINNNNNNNNNKQRQKRNHVDNNIALRSPANRAPPKGPTPSLWITLLQPDDDNSSKAPTADFIEDIFGAIGTIHSLRFGRGDYCFINFIQTKIAKMAMLQLNGKYIDNFGIITLKWAHPPNNMLHVNRGYTSDTTHMAIHHSQQHHREIQPQYHHRYEAHQPIVNFNAHLNDHRHHMYHQPVTHHRQLHHHQSSLMMPAQQYHHNGYHQTTNQHRVLVPITENHGYYHPQQQQQQQQQQYLEQPHSPEWSPVSTPQKVSHASPMRQHDNTAFVNNISDDKNNNEEDKGINCETIRIMLDGMTTLYKNGLQNYY